MAAVAPPADQASDLLRNLSLDSKPTAHHDAPEGTKQYVSVNSGEAPNRVPNERSLTPLLQDINDPSMCYLPSGYPSATYYYGAYDGSVNNWDEISRHANHEGAAPPAVYGDVYNPGYGYAPYNAYASPGTPIATVGHDGQIYGPQSYQYSTSYFHPSTAPYTANQATAHGNFSTNLAADKPSLPVDSSKANTNGMVNASMNGNSGPALSRPNQQTSSLTSSGSYGRGVFLGGYPSSGYQDPRYGYDGMRSQVPWYEVPAFHSGQHRPTNSTLSSAVSLNGSAQPARNQNHRPHPHVLGLQSPRPTLAPTSAGCVNRMNQTSRMCAQYGSAFSSLGFGSNAYDSRTSGRWQLPMDNKYKPRGRGNGFYSYGNENLDGFSELNRGPRAGRVRNSKGFGLTGTIAPKGLDLPTNGNVDCSAVLPEKDGYNRADFPDNHSDAKFFVIKSYSEDDIHKSIKYGVWASTPNGNKKLDAGYQEAGEKAGSCPIFLFFSVNTSGQFVGVAEMVGPVDFDKSVEYWQQDKWNGCFPVKWHIIKDVPNGLLKHITLDNNDNKPVTNSRDTQEVKLEQGLQMLKIFKEHVSKTSILDDFVFYEDRQNVMQEKRTKQQQFQKQVKDLKAADFVTDEKEKDATNGKPRLQKPLESVTILTRESSLIGLGERKPAEENGVATVSGEAQKIGKPESEKLSAADDVANGS